MAPSAEIRRVLRAGGHLFLVWNTRDRDHDWVRQFGDLLVDGPDAERPYDSYYDVDYAAPWSPRRAGSPRSSCGPTPGSSPATPTCSSPGPSRSASSARSRPADKERVLDRIRHLADTHPDLAGRARFPFPYTTARVPLPAAVTSSRSWMM